MRIALHTRLRPGAESDYDRAHQNVPAELLAAIRDGGARDWTIWRSGPDLFHVLDCEDYGALLASLAQLPVNIAWQLRMAGYLEVVHDYSEQGTDAGLPVSWDLSTALADSLPASRGTDMNPS